jgi:hypothetical protein
MIDSAGDLIEPFIRVIVKVVGWTVRLAAEVLLEAIPDILGGVFNYYATAMERRGWPGWVYVPVALLLTPLTLFAPVAVLVGVGFLIHGMLF